MNDHDRNKIFENLHQLVEGTNNFETLFTKLKEKGMFNNYMIREIEAVQDQRRRLEYLFRYVTTRGPHAFRNLCDALNETNNSNLALVLQSHTISIQNGSVSHESHLEEGNSHTIVQNGNSFNDHHSNEKFPFHDWDVKLSNRRFDNNTEEVYKMRANPRGLAMIINFKKYINDIEIERLGSEEDVKRLKYVLEMFHFEIIVLHDLTAQEFLQEMVSFGEKQKSSYDAAIVVVMGHGKTEGIGTITFTCFDGQTVNNHQIISPLKASSCEPLRGKPKLFIFQVCRGEEFNPPMAKKADTLPEGQTDYSSLKTDGTRIDTWLQEDKMRSDSDIFIACATSPGFVALRDEANGSYFIQTLCHVFAKHAWNTDLHSMFIRVDRLFSKMVEQGIVQTPTSYSKLRKCLYFQPGIYCD